MFLATSTEARPPAKFSFCLFWVTSLCHKKAPVPKGSGQSKVFLARWVHQSVCGWVRRNTHQPLPPYGTVAARRRAAHLPLLEVVCSSKHSAPICCSHTEPPLVNFKRLFCQESFKSYPGCRTTVHLSVFITIQSICSSRGSWHHDVSLNHTDLTDFLFF